MSTGSLHVGLMKTVLPCLTSLLLETIRAIVLIISTKFRNIVTSVMSFLQNLPHSSWHDFLASNSSSVPTDVNGISLSHTCAWAAWNWRSESFTNPLRSDIASTSACDTPNSWSPSPWSPRPWLVRNIADSDRLRPTNILGSVSSHMTIASEDESMSGSGSRDCCCAKSVNACGRTTDGTDGVNPLEQSMFPWSVAVNTCNWWFAICESSPFWTDALSSSIIKRMQRSTLCFLLMSFAIFEYLSRTRIIS